MNANTWQVYIHPHTIYVDHIHFFFLLQGAEITFSYAHFPNAHFYFRYGDTHISMYVYIQYLKCMYTFSVCVYIYIYIYTCIYIYVHIYIYVYICVCTYIRVFVSIHICIHIHVRICIHICVCLCVCARALLCMWVCACMCVWVLLFITSNTLQHTATHCNSLQLTATDTHDHIRLSNE